MVTTPRSHPARVKRTPVSARSAGPQDLDDPGPEPPVEITDADDEPVAEAEVATSTEDHRDAGRETGALYGRGIAPTGDVDDDGVRGAQEFDGTDGQTWGEDLLKSTATYGPAGAAGVDDVRGTDADDRDEDVPPADKGSGGPGGL